MKVKEDQQPGALRRTPPLDGSSASLLIDDGFSA